MPPAISVILPTYNRAGRLPGAIASVLSQSVTDLELIVVDDASLEDVAGVVAGIPDPRLRYVRRPVNGGAAAARNTGLAEARGRYIAFQDSDDIWLPGKLESQLALLSALPVAFGAVTGPKILYGRNDRSVYGEGMVSVTPAASGRLPRDGDQVGHLLGENRLSVQCALFRADCMPTRHWFDERARANEDWDFAVRLAQHARLFEHDKPVVLGFVSGDSISRSLRRQLIGELRVIRNNRHLLGGYPRQKASLLRDVARSLIQDGKPRWGRRFLMASIAEYPPSLFGLAQTLLRRIGRRGARVWRQAGATS